MDKAYDMVDDLVAHVSQWQKETGSYVTQARAFDHTMCIYLPDAIVYLYQNKYGVSDDKAEEMLEDKDVFLKCFNHHHPFLVNDLLKIIARPQSFTLDIPKLQLDK